MNREAREERQDREGDWGKAEAVTGRIIGFAIKVHRSLGPGLLENVYQDCLALEITRAGMRCDRQVDLPLVYEGIRFDRAYHADLIVEQAVVIEIKSIETILPVHVAQVLTYLRLSGCHIGLLLNFNEKMLKEGLRRLVLS